MVVPRSRFILTTISKICRTISEMRGTDRYERTVVRLELDGKDLAALLVAGGTHRTWDYDGREKKPDWCAGAAS